MSSLVAAEARAQPGHVADLFARRDEFAALADRLRGRFTHVVLAARGSSDNAARYAQYLFAVRNGLHTSLATPSVITRHGARPELTGALVIAISQSGASPDIAAVLAAASTQGAPTLAITNDPSSPLALAADDCIAIDVGPERSIAATKTYTASLAALAMLSLALDDDETARHQLAAVPAAMESAEATRMPEGCLEGWATARRGIVVGRGHEFATAHETALKLQELAGVIAQAHSAADVRHGPIGGLTGEVPVIVFGSSGAVAEDLVATTELLARHAPVTTIGNLGAIHPLGSFAWSLPEVAEWVAPMVSVVAGQRLAVALAQHLGLDPDNPTGLTKITRTR